ncbi:MAG TPA: hypothetical protein VGK40_09850 [Verrucomicrobiae bacterium]|jgi:hypothetical protein
MKHLYRIALALVLYAVAVYVFKAATKPEAIGPVDGVAATGDPLPHRPSTALEQELARQIEQRSRQLETQARHLERMEVAKSQMMARRREVQSASYAAWNEVLSANHEHYLQLRDQAGKTPGGQIPCTICDGFSYMRCVTCRNHDGKCITCKGTGRLALDAYCPSCLGSGKCYVCTGSGKMFCPFCDDGMIDARRPPPNSFPPLY